LIKRLPTRGEWQTAIDNLARDLKSAGVDVLLNTKAAGSTLRSLTPDVVVCATGAQYEKTGLSAYRPDRESIPGHAQDNVRDVASAVHSALADPRSLGTKVLILDETAAFLPFGLAEVLANAGAAVEVVTPHMFAAEDVFRTSEMPFLFDRLAKLDVRITAQQTIDRIESDQAEIRGIWGGNTRTVSGVSTFVIAVSRAPNDELYEEIRPLLKDVRRVGDALAPRRTAEVIYEGEKLGREL
jgi:hypothetical protein